MTFKIQKCTFEKIEKKLLTNIYDHISYFDSFLEEHIMKSEHYEILIGSSQIGYFSIFKNHLLTQFYLDIKYRYMSQDIFDKVRRYEMVEKAFVPTSDEFFLSHVFDYAKKIDTQAYFFKDSERVISTDKVLKNFDIRVAHNKDIDLIKEKSGDFFDAVERQVENQEIYIGFIHDDVASFGIIEKSKLYKNVASIGMFTIPGDRQSGIGRNTLLRLKGLCYESGITPIAGCWYYNHNSKKTLESAGFFSQTRLVVANF